MIHYCTEFAFIMQKVQGVNLEFWWFRLIH